jgi:hypothetical protein
LPLLLPFLVAASIAVSGCRFYCRFWLPLRRAKSQCCMILPDQFGLSQLTVKRSLKIE